MTTAHKFELEGITLFTLAAVMGIVFAMSTNHSPKIRTVYNLPVLAPLESPTPTEAILPKSQTFSQVSPDGRKKLTMTATPVKTGTTYTFNVSDGSGDNNQQLYTISLPVTETMSIPYNTFSPDNKYLFVSHTTKDGTEAWIFQTDGTPIATDTTYFNAKAIFDSRQTGNTYQEATGWASETLVIINTTRSDGSKSTSYWLEIPSKALIPLSTEF